MKWPSRHDPHLHGNLTRLLLFYGTIAVLLSWLVACVWSQDLRLEPGCHIALGCEDDTESPERQAVPLTPPAPPVPLFTAERVARDTAPEMLALLNRPTWAHAEAFVAKEQERLQAVRDAQRLIDAVKAGRKQP